MSYYEKYLKYKKKYLNLKGGQVIELSIPAVHADDFRELIKSNIKLYDYGHVKGRFEDCEHRSFHAIAINNVDAKIRISPEILFF